MLSQIITPIVNFLITTIGSWSYIGIFLLMAIESSIIPLPSELVLIPAGYLVSQGQMSAPIVLILAVAGSLSGALISYYLSFILGRKAVNLLVAKYGKFLFIDDNTLTKTEKFFSNHGEITTFTGRLLFGVRHLISIPAGFARMNLFKFSFYTALGSAVWSSILLYLGYLFGRNQSLISQNLNKISIIVIIALIILIVIYVIMKSRRKNFFNLLSN
jgi:membrane protein DedA with SNARE-associated domain